MSSKNLAILGAGNVGAALARVWAAAGHNIVFGVRDPRGEKMAKVLAALAGRARAAGNQEAVSTAEILALCVPWERARQAVETSGNLAGKILIDCTNPLAPDLHGLVVGATTSAAEQIAGWARGARVVKAFNTAGSVIFGNAQFGSVRADGFYCGDDAAAKSEVRELVKLAGFDPVDVGPLANARLLEPLAMLWIDLAVNQKQGVNHAFKLLRR